MKKIFAFIIGLTLICGSLFPVAAAEQGETSLPHHSEIIPPPAFGGEETLEEEKTTEAEQTSGNPGALAGTLGSAANAQTLQSAGIQASDEELTVSCDGFTAEMTNYGVSKYSSSSPDLYLFFHVVNDTDRVLNLTMDDVIVNGIDVMGTGIYEVQPGTDTGSKDERIWIMARPSVPEGEDAILDPQTLQGTLILMDDTTREELMLQEFTLDLTQLDGIYNDYTAGNYTYDDDDDDTDGPDAKYTSEPSYRTLCQGDTGEDVKNLQQALINLGYLYDTADGSFGPRTAAAVKDFNEANGLYGGSTADSNTQSLAFSGLANPYTEPWIPLTIGSSFYYDPVPSVNTFFFKVEVTNHSKNRTIKGYELSLYYTDVWGDWLDGGVIYTQTMTQPVYPGQTIYSANFSLGNWYAVDTVWVGVSKIVFDDGEIREEDPDDIVYYSCVIPTRIN